MMCVFLNKTKNKNQHHDCHFGERKTKIQTSGHLNIEIVSGNKK